MEEEGVTTAVRPRVLIVEDHEAQREFMTEVLRRNGYESDAAPSISDGEALFEKGRYACTLIDLGLPDGDGSGLLSKFSKIDPCIVQIVLTGDSSPETIINAMRLGAFDYLTKPIDLTTVTAAIARAISHHAVVMERAELFRLLYEEREQLRARVDAATADIRQYAAACETSNARLRALLHLTQTSGNHYTEETLFRRMFREVRHHLPLRAVGLCDPSSRRFLLLCLRERKDDHPEETLEFYSGGTPLDTMDYDPLLAEAEPDQMMRTMVERRAEMETSNLAIMAYPQEFWNRHACTVGFLLGPDFTPDPSDREFLDMCAYLLAFEWERGKLLFHVAHQASLGNIAVEIVRNFIQPLTAIRTASDFLVEELLDEDAAAGIGVIQENVDRLRRQTQEFRRLSTLRENSIETVQLEVYIEQAIDLLAVAIQNRNVTIHKDVESGCECVLLNGTALARTFLDLTLGALRAVDTGGNVWIALRNTESGHVLFELRHDGPQRGLFVDTDASVVASAVDSERAHLGFRLAERTVHSCGGTLSVDYDEENRGILRITLPRNATKPREPYAVRI